MIYEVLKLEKPYFQSKIQRYYINKVKLFVSTVPVDTLCPLLLDIGNGRVFGENVQAEIHLYDRPEFLAEAECLADQFTIACYPWISDIQVDKNLEEALKDADYLLIFPRLSDVNMSIENVINEQFNFLSTMAVGMDRYAKLTAKAVVVGKYQSLFCRMMAVFFKEIPWNQLTGLTRHVEKRVTVSIADHLKVPPKNFSGVTVLGENVVDVNMACVNMEAELIEIVNVEDLKKADNGAYELATFKKGQIPNPFEGDDEKITEFYENIRGREHTDCHKCLNMQQHLKTVKKIKQTEEIERTISALKNNVEVGVPTLTPEMTPEHPLDAHLKSLCVIEDLGEEEPFADLNRYLASDYDLSKPKEIYKMGETTSFYKESDYFINKSKNPIPLKTLVRRMADQRRKDRLKENYFYEDAHLKNVVLVPSVVDDLKFLYDTLPKMCENIYATDGAATARSLTEHLNLIHVGTDKPFSIMTCSMGAFGFPKEMFLSGPAKVNKKTKDIVFWQEYQMHERIRLILMKQIMKLKEDYEKFNSFLEQGPSYPILSEPTQKIIKEYVPVPRKKIKKPKKSLFSEESLMMPLGFEGG